MRLTELPGTQTDESRKIVPGPCKTVARLGAHEMDEGRSPAVVISLSGYQNTRSVIALTLTRTRVSGPDRDDTDLLAERQVYLRGDQTYEMSVPVEEQASDSYTLKARTIANQDDTHHAPGGGGAPVSVMAGLRRKPAPPVWKPEAQDAESGARAGKWKRRLKKLWEQHKTDHVPGAWGWLNRLGVKAGHHDERIRALEGLVVELLRAQDPNRAEGVELDIEMRIREYREWDSKRSRSPEADEAILTLPRALDGSGGGERMEALRRED